MNYAIIITLMGFVILTYFHLSRVIQGGVIRLPVSSVVAVLGGALFALILGGKLYSLANSSSIIEPEIVAPSYLTEAGKNAIGQLLMIDDHRTASDICILTHSCSSPVQELDSKYVTIAHDLTFSLDSPEKTLDWLRKNDMSANDISAWRGRYIHHYNTILFPYRSIVDGSFSEAFASQYGVMSILPLFLLNGQPFVLYACFGLIVLISFGLLLMYEARASTVDSFVAAFILLVIALSCNVVALRLSPGFSFFRYLPVLGLTWIIINIPSIRDSKYLCIIALFALMNSLQFNVLVLLVAGLSHGVIMFRDRKFSFLLPSVSLVIALVSALQYYIYVGARNAFSPALFGSVGEGEQSLPYLLMLLGVPILALIFKLIILKKCSFMGGVLEFSAVMREQFSDSEVVAYISYLALATYSVAFVGSPQHFSGFLQMAYFSIFTIIAGVARAPLKIILLSILFIFPGCYYSYFQFSNSFTIIKSSFYDYTTKFGVPLYFRTPSNVSALSAEYSELVSSYVPSEKIYFLSKDKIFIENFQGTNIAPKSYDVFTNWRDLSVDSIRLDLRRNNIKYIVMDGDFHISAMRGLIKLHSGYLGSVEYAFHDKILQNQLDLSGLISGDVIRCSSRYCIYRVDSAI